MPAALQSTTGTSSQHSVLLIEEYDALAAAIDSALKKFAPQHATVVARSLGEAEALTKKIEPDLFVIDFDPVYPGLTEFLCKMRSINAEARVLVIAAGISNEIAGEWRSLGALQFIKKPFEVADFGAAVQALLGPWKSAESAQSRGTLQSLSLADIVLLQCAGGRSVTVEVQGSNSKSGEIHVVGGQLVHAKAGKRTGTEALEEMFGWAALRMQEAAKSSSAAHTIQGPWMEILFEASRQVRALQPIEDAPRTEPPPAPRLKTGKKIVVIDDTEMLLIFVEDTLASANPELQITTALNGTSGIKQIEYVKPDLVLLDYSLPDLNGKDVCRRLLQNEQTARIPVLMMSGHVVEMAEVAASCENVVATLAKPFLSEALVALVKQTLGAEPRMARRIAEVPKHVEPPQIAAPRAREMPVPLADHKPVEPTPSGPARTYVAAPDTMKVRTISAPVLSTQPNDVVLGLFLEVVSMQLTPSLRMGTIRAKPSSSAVSLHVSPVALRAALPAQTAFQLGPVELDADGRIATLRLIPTLQPFQHLQTLNACQIGGVAVVSVNSHECVQLTPTTTAPMTMQLLAQLELAGVELSANFQVAQLVLKNYSNTVRVMLGVEALGQEQTGATCETAAVRLDNSARIAELLLNPIK
ncbi:MAG: response regulator [Verrucomicrobiota bacterium]|nr:response regulator [Verrucomicrobiota bacterium]